MPGLPLTPGAPCQKISSCAIVFGFEKPLKTIKILCKYKMVPQSFKIVDDVVLDETIFCFIKRILYTANTDVL